MDVFEQSVGTDLSKELQRVVNTVGSWIFFKILERDGINDVKCMEIDRNPLDQKRLPALQI